MEGWLLPTVAALAGLLIGFVISWTRNAASGRDFAEGPSKIERIKQYRERYGVGLKQAKLAVEAELRGEQVPQPTRAVRPPASVEALLAGGNTIEAIKLYREQTGVGLKEAKDAIDALCAQRDRDQPR
jgi:ribosomal protein L7/L12